MPDPDTYSQASTLRETFTSNWGFLCTAASSAIGLGNIWSFPTLAAQYGGSAFLLAYIVITFLLAWPLLTLELSAGKFGGSDNITIMKIMAENGGSQLAWLGGHAALIFITTAAALYSIVGGWVLSHLFDAIQNALGFTFITANNFFWSFLFLLITTLICTKGLRKGVELWAKRLLPCLLILLIGMVCYVFQLDTASSGLAAYLTPDFHKAIQPDVLLAALGQSFFSLSLGGTTMLVYGSYLSRNAKPPQLATQVVTADFLVSLLAGMIIVPLIYVASQTSNNAIATDGVMASGPSLAFDVLPSLFATLGLIGHLLAIAFFGLLWLASVTSAMSMLEVPISRLQTKKHSRPLACRKVFFRTGCLLLILLWGGNDLLMSILKFCTQLVQPCLAICVCLLAGWYWQRRKFLNAISETATKSIFWKGYAFYIQVVCPLLIITLLVSLWI